MRPYIIISAAMSADGKISTTNRVQTKISTDNDLSRVTHLRYECDAIMVGIGTILSDNPSLRLKDPSLVSQRISEGRDSQPMRIVIDSHCKIPIDSDIFQKGTGKCIVFVSESAPRNNIELISSKSTVMTCGHNKVDLSQALSILWDMGVKKLMIEGGATLLWSITSQKLFDEIRIFIGSCIIGGSTAPTLVDGTGFTNSDEFVQLKLSKIDKIDDGVLLTWIKKE